MALAANTVYEVQTGGNDTNGGGFVTGAAGSDYSLITGKRTGADVTNISTTDAVGNGTTTLTSATGNFTSALIGNIIYLQGGTGALAATRRQVTAVGSATSITVDATVATGTGITMNIGGCLASPGEAGRVGGNGQTVWIKSGTYTISSASTGVSGGCYNVISQVFGYQTTRGDFTSTRPLLQANGVITAFTIFSSNVTMVRGINFDGNSRTSSRGVLYISSNSTLADCNFANFTNNAFLISGGAIAINCKATGCSTVAAMSLSGTAVAYNCVAHDNTFTGFSFGTGASAIRCIADTNTGATSDGFAGASSTYLFNCVAYNNGRHGFVLGAYSTAINCIAENQTVASAIGFNNSGSPAGVLWYNCAAYNNNTNFFVGTGKGSASVNPVTGSASFFTNPGSQDFSLNNTAGGGASARDAGIPGVSPDGNTTGYLDIGYAQHQASAGGGGAHSAVF